MSNNTENKKEISLNLPKPRQGAFIPLALVPDVQVLFVGAAACTRHRAHEMLQLMRKERMSILLLDEVDFVTGGYIDKIKDAVRELHRLRSAKGFIILPNCQSALLSTDYGIITGELTSELGIPVKVREGCHICGFEAEGESDSSGNTEQLVYGFLNPRERDSVKSVNIISLNPVSKRSELFETLKNAGVEKINEIGVLKTFSEYQSMAGAHLNIMLGDSADALGESLKSRLGIPYVKLSGIYNSAEIKAKYREIGEILGADIDTSETARNLIDRFNSLLPELKGVSVIVGGDAGAAKFLIENGVKVSAVMTNPHFPIDPSLEAWIKQNSPETAIGLPKGGRGGRGSGGNHRGYGGHPGHANRGGNGRGGMDDSSVAIGYSAVETMINLLENELKEGKIR